MSKALHHRPEMRDMRSAYTGFSDSDGDRSYQELHSGSDKSYQTPPTSYSSSPTRKQPQVHYDTDDNRHQGIPDHYFDDRHLQESPRSSAETYASTAESEEELPQENPEYDAPDYTPSPYESAAVPATPSDFSQLFPSKRRLAIRHDDSTLDGNMNLRLDTEVNMHGETCEMTLFHLRMHDLKNRQFSLRRYCRDSGREVCHSSRKQSKPLSDKRPGLQRSLSNALNSMRPKSDQRSSSSPTAASLKRFDSGYGSMHSVDFGEDRRPRSSGNGAVAQEPLSTDTIKLEFSNYAQAYVKRHGSSRTKRYEFEYWGTHYAWKQVSQKVRDHDEISYQLTKLGNDCVLAFIVPVALTPRQAQEEQSKGGWVPPCSMWIADETIVRAQKDVSDVVIASGLMALVDDSIRARFHSKSEKSLLIPVPKLPVGVEYVGPKRLINEMFSRKDSYSSQQSRQSSTSRPSTGDAANRTRPAGPGRLPSYDY